MRTGKRGSIKESRERKRGCGFSRIVVQKQVTERVSYIREDRTSQRIKGARRLKQVANVSMRPSRANQLESEEKPD